LQAKQQAVAPRTVAPGSADHDKRYWTAGEGTFTLWRMEYVYIILRAAWYVGLPLFVLSFALIGWALYRGRVEGETLKDLQLSMDALGKQQKDEKTRQKIDPALGKWYSFGGGFYGLVALYTWLLIEIDDVADFISDLGALVFQLDIGVLISFFIQSLMNFVWAIAWPVYWLRAADNPWIWFIVAYGGYWLGIQAAQRVAKKRWPGEGPLLPGFDRQADERSDDPPA